MRNRNLWTMFLILLRRWNLLCRKTQVNYAVRKRVSHVVLPYEGYKPNWQDSAQHIYFEVRSQYKEEEES